MIRVALQGSYFGHNFGDVLLLSLYTKWIRETLEDCEVVLPQATADMVSSIGADSRGFTELFRTRGLIYAGGGYFGEPPGSPSEVRRWSIRNFYRHMPGGGALTLLGRPIAIIGVGAGPLSNAIFRSAVRQLVESAVIAAVRDDESRLFLRSIGVTRNDLEVTADAALCVSSDDIPEEYLVDVKSRFASRGDNVIGVHLPASRSFSEGVEAVITGIEAVMKRHRDLEIVVMSDNVSYDPQLHASRFLARYSNRVHVAQYQDPWRLVALLSQLRMVVTTKLHVGIVATAVGTLPLSFPYHPKTERFYRQIGAPELCIPLIRVDRERVLDQFDRALGMALSKDYRYKLPHGIREAARRNKELVERFIGIVLDNIQ